jgi:hypothetical protein
VGSEEGGGSAAPFLIPLDSRISPDLLRGTG